MIKRLAGCVREYKKSTILTLIFIVGEAFIETFIPFITAKLVNLIKYNAPMEQVVRIGLFLVLMACLSLCCGGIAGDLCQSVHRLRAQSAPRYVRACAELLV